MATLDCLGPLSDVCLPPGPALPAWPACWSLVAWAPESVQASPCQACPTFPKGRGPEGQLSGGEGPIGPKVSRPLPQLFEFPRPIPPWTSTNKKKHRQSRPFRRTAPPFKESMRDEIRRAASITDEHFTRVPQPCGPTCVPLCQRATRHTNSFKIKSQSRSPSEVES